MTSVALYASTVEVGHEHLPALDNVRVLTILTPPQFEQWGVEQADRDGLTSYLSASEKGKKLYERLNFVEVDEDVMDLAPYGVDGKRVTTIMTRLPRRGATSI